MSTNPRNNFRLTLWIFMTFVIGYMLVFTITHGGETWRIVAFVIAFLIGLTTCFFLYKARKNDS